jgi:hypothetical protein
MNNNVQIFKTMALTLDDADFEAAFSIMQSERDGRREKRYRQNRNKLKRGSLVEWTGNKSGTCTGEVVKVKTKKAIVKQTSAGRAQGQNWDIPMSMLRVVG